MAIDPECGCINSEMVDIIRGITDAAGAKAIPFLDDAVSVIVNERDAALGEVDRWKKHAAEHGCMEGDARKGFEVASKEAAQLAAVFKERDAALAEVERLRAEREGATYCCRCGEHLETHGDEKDCKERREQEARDFREMLTKPQEQVDADLRAMGVNPEEVAGHGRVFVEALFDLRDAKKERDAALAEVARLRAEAASEKESAIALARHRREEVLAAHARAEGWRTLADEQFAVLSAAVRLCSKCGGKGWFYSEPPHLENRGPKHDCKECERVRYRRAEFERRATTLGALAGENSKP